MDPKQWAVAAALAAVILGQLWMGRVLDGPSRHTRRAGGPWNATAIEHDVRRLPRVSAAELASNAGAFDFGAPFVLTGLCEPTADSADPCHLRDGTWSAGAMTGTSAGGDAQSWGWAREASVEFYPHNMDEFALLRTGSRVPLPVAVAVTAGLPGAADGWPADDDAVSPPRRYAHWNVNATGDWARLTTEMLGGVLAARLPPQLLYTQRWLDDVLVGGGSGSDEFAAGNAAAAGAPDDDALAADWCAVTHWRMLLVGNHGAGMFNHRDNLPTGAWQLQLAGAKRWHLCAPDQAAHVAVVPPGAPRDLVYGMPPNVGLNLLRPGDGQGQANTYAAHPRARNASCALEVLAPGEAIVYPADWWHQTESVVGAPGGLSVALTESVVTPGSWEALGRVTAVNCAKVHRPGVTPSPALCARLPALVAHWRRRFGGDEGGGSAAVTASEGPPAAKAAPPTQHSGGDGGAGEL